MSWEGSRFAPIAELVEQKAGFRLKPEAHSGHEKLLNREMQIAGTKTPEAYFRKLKKDTEIFQQLLDSIMIGETFFFRHHEQFDFIRDRILPEISKRCGKEHLFRFWSAGCSSGEEPYSLAMLMKEEGLVAKTKIIATDICRTALAKARKGQYRKWSLRGPAAARALPHLRSERAGFYQLSDSILNNVTFQYLNLAKDCYPDKQSGLASLDLILCRNVMIYFGTETIAAICDRFYRSLAPGGFLLTAATDPLVENYAPFEKEVFDDIAIYSKPESRSEKSSDRGRVASASEAALSPESIPEISTHRAIPKPKEEARPAPPKSKEKIIKAPTSLGEEKKETPSIKEALEAFERGSYEETARLTEPQIANEEAAALHLRALANLDSERAATAGELLLKIHPISAELHYLVSSVQMAREDYERAGDTLRKFAYLGGQSPLAHFLIGILCQRNGDKDASAQAFRKARAACSLQPRETVVPYCTGQTYGGLDDAAANYLKLILSPANAK